MAFSSLLLNIFRFFFLFSFYTGKYDDKITCGLLSSTPLNRRQTTRPHLVLIFEGRPAILSQYVERKSLKTPNYCTCWFRTREPMSGERTGA